MHQRHQTTKQQTMVELHCEPKKGMMDNIESGSQQLYDSIYWYDIMRTHNTPDQEDWRRLSELILNAQVYLRYVKILH